MLWRKVCQINECKCMALEDLCDMDYFYGDLFVVFWSLTAIATVNCHSMGKNSRKKYRLHAGFGRVKKHRQNINFG